MAGLLLLSFALSGAVFLAARRATNRPLVRGARGQRVTLVAGAFLSVAGGALGLAAVKDATPENPSTRPAVVSLHLDGHPVGQDVAVSVVTELGDCDARARVTLVATPTADAGLPSPQQTVRATLTLTQRDIEELEIGLLDRRAGPLGPSRPTPPRPKEWRRAIESAPTARQPADGTAVSIALPEWGVGADRAARLPSLVASYTTDAVDDRSNVSCWLHLPVLRGQPITDELRSLGLGDEPAAAGLPPAGRRGIVRRPGSAVAAINELVMPADLTIDEGASRPEPTLTSQFLPPRWTCAYSPGGGADRPDTTDEQPGTRFAYSAAHHRASLGEQAACASAVAIVDSAMVSRLQLMAFAGGLLLGLGLNLLVSGLVSDFNDPQHSERAASRRRRPVRRRRGRKG